MVNSGYTGHGFSCPGDLWANIPIFTPFIGPNITYIANYTNSTLKNYSIIYPGFISVTNTFGPNPT